MSRFLWNTMPESAENLIHGRGHSPAFGLGKLEQEVVVLVPEKNVKACLLDACCLPRNSSVCAHFWLSGVRSASAGTLPRLHIMLLAAANTSRASASVIEPS